AGGPGQERDEAEVAHWDALLVRGYIPAPDGFGVAQAADTSGHGRWHDDGGAGLPYQGGVGEGEGEAVEHRGGTDASASRGGDGGDVPSGVAPQPVPPCAPIDSD